MPLVVLRANESCYTVKGGSKYLRFVSRRPASLDAGTDATVWCGPLVDPLSLHSSESMGDALLIRARFDHWGDGGVREAIPNKDL